MPKIEKNNKELEKTLDFQENEDFDLENEGSPSPLVRKRTSIRQPLNTLQSDGVELKRRTLDSSQFSRLHVPKRFLDPKLHYRWVDADPGRIQYLEDELGYSKVQSKDFKTRITLKNNREQILMYCLKEDIQVKEEQSERERMRNLEDLRTQKSQDPEGYVSDNLKIKHRGDL